MVKLKTGAAMLLAALSASSHPWITPVVTPCLTVVSPQSPPVWP